MATSKTVLPRPQFRKEGKYEAPTSLDEVLRFKDRAKKAAVEKTKQVVEEEINSEPVKEEIQQAAVKTTAKIEDVIDKPKGAIVKRPIEYRAPVQSTKTSFIPSVSLAGYRPSWEK